MKNLFQHPRIGPFFQAAPRIGNVYLGDGFLQRVLERLLPSQVFQEVHHDLTRLGTRIETEIEPLGLECEQNPPYLAQYDPWGSRIDQVVTCAAWKQMKTIAAEERIIASGYDGQYGPHSRIYQFAKCFIFHPSSGLYSCPLAMTDGAAKTIQAHGLKARAHFATAFEKLTSGDPGQFWTSGQWMTERRGGSDVADGTETVAVPVEGGGGAGGPTHLLYGYKWFSSATDADVAFTLARVQESDGNLTKGTRGLSMFFLRTRRDDGALNGIQVMKLKNKLGTRSLPTGELLLDGVEAVLASEPGRGVASITPMLTMTRIHNTTGSVAAMRRVLLLARDYATKRTAFGKPISEYPLHLDTLSEMELLTRGGTVLLFEMLRLLGRVEHGADVDGKEALLLRILTPVAKLYTAKKCMSVVSEGLECFGGQGYIEDTGLPAIFRNSQVLPIWEGTTNVLSLDMLRAIASSKGEALLALQENLTQRLEAVRSAGMQNELGRAGDTLQNELNALTAIFPGLGIDEAMARARLLAYSVAEIVIGVLLSEHAVATRVKSDVDTATRWVRAMGKVAERFGGLQEVDLGYKTAYGMVFDGYEGSELMEDVLEPQKRSKSKL